jgi:hypothetical protein
MFSATEFCKGVVSAWDSIEYDMYPGVCNYQIHARGKFILKGGKGQKLKAMACEAPQSPLTLIKTSRPVGIMSLGHANRTLHTYTRLNLLRFR